MTRCRVSPALGCGGAREGSEPKPGGRGTAVVRAAKSPMYVGPRTSEVVGGKARCTMSWQM